MSHGISLVNAFAVSWADALLRACWQGGLGIALVWLLCRLWPAMPAGPRCWLWRLAYLKLLLGLVWLPPLALPLLPRPPAPPVTQAAAPPVQAPPDDVPLTVTETAPAFAAPPAPAFAAPPAPLATTLPPPPRPIMPTVQTWLLAAWILGMLASLGRVASAWRRACTLSRASRPVTDEALQADAADLSRRLGLRRVPPLRVAADLPSPLLLALGRPAILLPAFVVSGSPRPELRLMLAHELAHLARRDLLWNALPLLAQRLFFFHPLVWLAGHEWALTQEIACDALAVQTTGTPPSAYGRMLLGIATRRRTSAASLFPTLAVAAPRHTLRRRLHAMQHIGTVSRPRLILAAALTLLLAVGGLLPWRVVAQSGASVSTPPAVTQKEEAAQEKEKAEFDSRNAQLDAQIAAILKPLSPEQQKKAKASIAFMDAGNAKTQQHIQMLEQHRADYLAAHPNRLSDAQVALVQKFSWDKLDPYRINEGIRWEQSIERRLQAHIDSSHDARSRQGWQRQITAIEQQRLAAEKQIRELEPEITREEAEVAAVPEDQRARVAKLRSYDSEISAYKNIALMGKQMRIALLRQQIVGTSHTAQPNHTATTPVHVSPAMAAALDEQIARLEEQQSAALKKQQRTINLPLPRTGAVKEETGAASEGTVIAFLKARRAGAVWAQTSIASPELSPGLKGQKLDNLRRFEQQAQQDKYVAEKYVFLLATKLIMRENRHTPLISLFSEHGPLRVRIFAQDANGRHLILDKLAHGKNLIIPSVLIGEGSKLDFLVYDNGKQVKEWWL